jgi:DNA-binding PadR family transcriptional regulator
MKKKVVLSHAERVLLAIYRVSNGTANRVPFEEIVIRAWKDFPKQFSLNNRPEYPDAYPVSKRLTSDLVTSRLVTSVSKEVYRLTYKGLETAEEIENRLAGEKVEESSTKTLLNREQEDIIKHAVHSRTFLTWKQDKRDDLIDYDARMFFQFSTGTQVRTRKRKVETVRETIEKAVLLEMKDALALKELCDFLIQKFPDLFQEG